MKIVHAQSNSESWFRVQFAILGRFHDQEGAI